MSEYIARDIFIREVLLDLESVVGVLLWCSWVWRRWLCDFTEKRDSGDELVESVVVNKGVLVEGNDTFVKMEGEEGVVECWVSVLEFWEREVHDYSTENVEVWV